MKFQSVTFRCFGPFDEQTIDLSGPVGLRVVFGENEAGKSSALRGLLAFLFGFPGQSSDDFRFKYNQFRIHALLENGGIQPFECIRRKGNKDTLRSGDDKTVIPERELTKFLGGLDEVQFKQLFGLDAKRLREGGQAIVDGQGELGEALFAAGAGMKGLRSLSQHLEQSQQNLFISGKRTQVITKGLSELRDLSDQVGKLALPPETFSAAVTAANAATAKVTELIENRLKLRSRLAILNRYKAALPTINLLTAARKQLEPVIDAPLLSTDFDVKVEKAREKLSIATSELANLESDKQKLIDQLKEEPPADAMLSEECEIGELKKLVGADLKARAEEVKATTFSIDDRGKARDIYRELTGSTDWEQMDGLKPRLDERNRINRLANERAAVLEDANRGEEAVRKAKKLLEEGISKQIVDAVPPDPTPWQDVLDEVAFAGPLDDQLERLTNTNQLEEQRLSDEFARMHPTLPGAWQNARLLSIPSAEAVESFRQELESARGKITLLAGEKKEIEGKIESIRESLIEKVGSEPVPTIDALAAARQDRDGGLHCIRLRLAGAVAEQAEVDFTNRHALGKSLMDAAESSVRHCDTLADRLRHEADRVATFQSIQQQLKGLNDRLAKVVGNADKANEAVTAIETRWQAIWQPSGICPLDPKVMQSWLTNWTKFRDRVGAWQSNCRERDLCVRKIDSCRSRLSGACAETQSAKTLKEGMALVKRMIAETTAARTGAEKRNAEIQRLRAALETYVVDLEKAKARSNEWDRHWIEAVAVLRLKETTPSIETAQTYLNRIDMMQQHLRDMRLKDARVKEIKNERIRLIDRINLLRKRLEPAARSTTEDSLDADLRILEAALQEATARRTRHQELSRQLGELEKKLGRTLTNLTESNAALSALAADAGVEVREIPVAVQRARERAEFASHVRQYETVVAQNALGESTEVFIAHALAHREALNNDLLELDLQIAQLDSNISEAEAISREADRKVDGYRQASDAAAEVQQKAALLTAQIKDQVIEFASLHLARTALDKAKEQYRARNQDTLLDRAAGYFRKLTHAAFTGIDIDNEEGSDVLKAVRASSNLPDARVLVAGLSDGTRDQLFLALRLAGIEQHLKERREPVPLIIDDVLINFDDERARATLGCLAELAKETQVIIFTHHRHLVDLARTVDPSTIVRELTPCS